ncbi:MAG: UbiD family decarboxylase [Chloroflexi bacterium]|nr:UbiD family decarboxylase [Chloroflexota bacterium]
MPFTDLRQFLAVLEERGDLVRIREEVDPKFEIAAYIRKTSDAGGPAILFERVRGSTIPVVGGIFAHRRRAVLALDATPEVAVDRFNSAIASLLPTRRVSSGTCQEVVHRGQEADLTRLPIPTYSAKDCNPYITAGMVVSQDPETGSKNASIYRLEMKDGRRLGILCSAGHHLAMQFARAEARGKPLEVAIVLGPSPATLMATQWEAPYGVDELALAGALHGQPVEVVKCQTVDLEVPASAEIVIEGRILPAVREMEGPFGEYTGYYTDTSPKPVIEVTAITHRRDAIFQALLTGVPTTENHVIKMVPLEASYYSMLKARFPGVRAVHFPGPGGVGLMAVVSMRQTIKYEARSVIMAVLSATRNKLVVVVDDDIDPYNLEQVMWAVCTRAQPDQDMTVVPRLAGGYLDPSSRERDANCCLGIDATRPFGQPFAEVATVPGLDRVPDPSLWGRDSK